MKCSVLTQHQYISFGYMFRFLQDHLQANANYRDVHSVCTHTHTHTQNIVLRRDEPFY